MDWVENEIWLTQRPEGEDVLVRCWYTPDRKWRVIEEPPDPEGVVKYSISLGMVGPNYEKHGRRWWVKRVWVSPSLEEAQHTVERQAG